MYYFQTLPQLLTVDQAVHLVLVLPSPNSWNKGLKDKSLTPFGKKRFTQILYRMKMRGFISESRYRYELSVGNFGRSLQESPDLDDDYLIEDDDIEQEVGLDESTWNNGSEGREKSSKIKAKEKVNNSQDVDNATDRSKEADIFDSINNESESGEESESTGEESEIPSD